MPRLTDYYHGQDQAAGPKQLPTEAAKPLAPHQNVQPAVQHHQQQQEQQLQQGRPQAPALGAAGLVAPEIARLRQQHDNRLKQHGARMFRQPDGSLGASQPPKQPYTVANRRNWHGVVQHCRQLPGVNQQLERSGRSARYGVNVTREQHVAALAAAGLTPEFDASGSWLGFEQGADDPLADSSHSLRQEGWNAIIGAVLDRAVAVHGKATLQENRWCPELY